MKMEADDTPPAGPPMTWGRDDVARWLCWCRRYYEIQNVNPANFCMNGRALCLLTREDFLARVPHVGDVLYRDLRNLTTPHNNGPIPGSHNESARRDSMDQDGQLNTVEVPQDNTSACTPIDLSIKMEPEEDHYSKPLDLSLHHHPQNGDDEDSTVSGSEHAQSPLSFVLPPAHRQPSSSTTPAPTPNDHSVLKHYYSSNHDTTPSPNNNNNNLPVHCDTVPQQSTAFIHSPADTAEPHHCAILDSNNITQCTVDGRSPPANNIKRDHVEGQTQYIAGNGKYNNIVGTLSSTTGNAGPKTETETEDMDTGCRTDNTETGSKDGIMATGNTVDNVDNTRKTAFKDSKASQNVYIKTDDNITHTSLGFETANINPYLPSQSPNKPTHAQQHKQYETNTTTQGASLNNFPNVKDTNNTYHSPPPNSPQTSAFNYYSSMRYGPHFSPPDAEHGLYPLSPNSFHLSASSTTSSVTTAGEMDDSVGDQMEGVAVKQEQAESDLPLPNFNSLVDLSSSGQQADSATSGEALPKLENRLLWEFIHELLVEQQTSVVRWHNETDLAFTIADPIKLAKLWGNVKRKDNMNYDKLARALRYYYKMNIISKVQGRRLTYRFLKHPSKIEKGIRGAKPGVPHQRRNKKPEELVPLWKKPEKKGEKTDDHKSPDT